MHMPSLLASVFVIVVLLAPAAICASAQENRNAAARPEIRGVVLEPGAELPVVEAEVTLEFYGETRLAQSRAQVHAHYQDGRLRFLRLSPDDFGHFKIRAKKRWLL